MINKYTIIDNFDKLDLAFLADEAFGGWEKSIYDPAELPELPTGEDEKTGIIYKNFMETIHLPSVWNATEDKHISNYKLPISFDSGLNYLPDMFRYLTSRRFFIDQNDHSLKFPSCCEAQPNMVSSDWFPSDQFPFGKLNPYEGMIYFFHILEIEKLFKRNGQIYANSLRFRDYYTLDVESIQTPWIWTSSNTIIPPYLTSKNKWVDIQSHLNLMQLPDSAFFANIDLSDGGIVTIPVRQYFNFDQGKIGPSNFNYLWMMKPFGPDDDQVKKMFEAFTNPIFRDILMKLLSFQKLTQVKPPPAANKDWIISARHLYFVADLPRGTYKDSAEMEIAPVVNTNYVSIESKYNYYAEFAEEAVNPADTFELQLPNLYTYHSLRTKKTNYYKKLAAIGENTPINPDEFSVQNYYELVAKTEYANPDPDPAWWDSWPYNKSIPPMFRYKNIVVSDKSYLDDANTFADLFPMYNKITLPAHSSTPSAFMKILQDNKLVNEFITLLAGYFIGVRSHESSIHKFAVHNGGIGDDVSLSTAFLQIMELEKFWGSMNFLQGEQEESTAFIDPPFFAPKITNYVKYFYDDKNAKFGFNEPAVPGVPIGDAPTDKAISLYGIKQEVGNYFDSKKLEPEKEIYFGEKCHTEILAFEIAKFRIGPTGARHHIQSVFLPSLFLGDDQTYIDTQIHHGTTYVYEIFTHSLVVGSRYYFNRKKGFFGGVDPIQGIDDQQVSWYVKPSGDAAPGEGGAVNADNFIGLSGIGPVTQPFEKYNPNVAMPIIVRAPYYNNKSLLPAGIDNQELTLIMDKPPLPPDIVFHPYKDDDSKILILLNLNYGERKMVPFIIFPEDQEMVEKQKLAQGFSAIYGGAIQYKTDEGKGDFLVYRTTTKPNNWGNFSNSDVTIINSANNIGYNDPIAPNTDYYYFARFQDVHQNFSNPTEIFHIRIVKEGGFPPYLITEIHTFRDAAEKTIWEIPFKKYLKIKLNDEVRYLINENKGIEEAELGYKKAGTSGSQLKKYKIRITSKKTGKKIDINLDFDKKINKNYLNKALPAGAVIGELGDGVPVDLLLDGNKEISLEDAINAQKEAKINNPDNMPVDGPINPDGIGGI